ncbi:MAG: YeeE/YedE family protein [Nitrospirae bacterium]|nr:YeeE/YedE family protein [Nitrospirota bacterium]
MKDKRFWSPYVAGICLGLTLLATFYIAGRGLGASGAITLVTAQSTYSVIPDFISHLTYFEQYITPLAPLINWNLFLLGGLFVGSLASASLSGNFKVLLDRGKSMSVRNRLFTSLVGGMLIGFAARLARGCTSGIALSGGAQLAVSGWIFVISMFAAGFIIAALFRRLWS